MPWHPEQFCLYSTRKSVTSLGRMTRVSAVGRPGDPQAASPATRISAPYFIVSAPADAPALGREPLCPCERSTVLAGGWEFVPEPQLRARLQLRSEERRVGKECRSR